MTWLAVVLLVIGVWLAVKLVGFLLKLALWAAVLFGAYWLAAPYLGLPPPF